MSGAVLLARDMVEQGVGDVEAVARLRAQGTDPQALRAAVNAVHKNADTGYPASRVYRLLRGAVGEPVPTPTPEQQAAEELQRALWRQPFDVSFRQLAERVAGLRELEQRALSEPDSFLRELSFRESGMIGRTPPRTPREREIRIVMGIHKAVERLIGPGSGVPDPVLASRAAERAAVSHLQQAAGLDPRNWTRPRPAG